MSTEKPSSHLKNALFTRQSSLQKRRHQKNPRSKPKESFLWILRSMNNFGFLHTILFLYDNTLQKSPKIEPLCGESKKYSFYQWGGGCFLRRLFYSKRKRKRRRGRRELFMVLWRIPSTCSLASQKRRFSLTDGDLSRPFPPNFWIISNIQTPLSFNLENLNQETQNPKARRLFNLPPQINMNSKPFHLYNEAKNLDLKPVCPSNGDTPSEVTHSQWGRLCSFRRTDNAKPKETIPRSSPQLVKQQGGGNHEPRTQQTARMRKSEILNRCSLIPVQSFNAYKKTYLYGLIDIPLNDFSSVCLVSFRRLFVVYFLILIFLLTKVNQITLKFMDSICWHVVYVDVALILIAYLSILRNISEYSGLDKNNTSMIMELVFLLVSLCDGYCLEYVCNSTTFIYEYLVPMITVKTTKNFHQTSLLNVCMKAVCFCVMFNLPNLENLYKECFVVQRRSENNPLSYGLLGCVLFDIWLWMTPSLQFSLILYSLQEQFKCNNKWNQQSKHITEGNNKVSMMECKEACLFYTNCVLALITEQYKPGSFERFPGL